MNKLELEAFFTQAKKSRVQHSVDDRLFALEFMVCAISASLADKERDSFLKTMNSLSESFDPSKDLTLKAIADLNVLGADFKTLSNQLANEK